MLQEYQLQAAKVAAMDELFMEHLPTITEEINASGEVEEKPRKKYNKKLFSKTAS
jgi:hypothetical protein